MKTKLIVKSALSVLVALGVAACSSGGAGGKSSTVINKPATEMKKEADATATATADQKQRTDANQVESTIPNEQPHKYASLVVLNDKTLNTTKLDALIKDNINYSPAGQLLVKVDEGKYGTSDDILLFLASEDNKMLMTLTNPNVTGWQYQTIALVNDTAINEEGELGFISLGKKSEASAIPTEGKASYQGKLTGRSLLQQGGMKKGTVQSDLTVDIDFATKAVTFKTENSTLSSQSNPSFNLSGSAKLDSANNAFIDGAVHLTSSSEYKGELKGALFGPKAEEVGGTFNIGSGKFTGAFGAKTDVKP